MFIISGTLERDKKYETLAREELQGYESRAQITYLTDLPPEELTAKTKLLPERSVVLYVWQKSHNEQGKILEAVDVLALFARSARVPIYGMSRRNIGSGIVGGYISSSEATGTRAAGIALQIANGARAQDIPVESVPAVPIFDWRELRHWGISEESLPPGSIVRFKELGFWELYRGRIIAVVALLVAQTLLIAGL